MSSASSLTSSPSMFPRPKTGLVLGAGGVRGCAHAGVVAVLEERGVPIDLVVGASVGALFGLGVAAGIPGQKMVDIVRESTPGDLVRFYANRLRPGRRNPIARMLLEAGEGKTFDDLEVPFAVTATDMETGRPVMINRGPVLDAVQASIALPFIARPVRLNGHYYLDGGLFDTAPVQVARALGAEHVIAVCLGFNYRAPEPFQKRPWMQGILRRAGEQRWVPRGSFLDQIRFFCHLVAESYDPPPPADGDITIRPDLGTLSPNSMRGAHFCLERGLIAARDTALGAS